MLAYGFWSAVLIIRICSLDRPTDLESELSGGVAIRQQAPSLRASPATPLAGEGHPV
jgi:hypothetical protein